MTVKTNTTASGMPRIVIVHKNHPIDLWRPNGGAETATLALARELAGQGIPVSVAGRFVSLEQQQGVGQPSVVQPSVEQPANLSARYVAPINADEQAHALADQQANGAHDVTRHSKGQNNIDYIQLGDSYDLANLDRALADTPRFFLIAATDTSVLKKFRDDSRVIRAAYICHEPTLEGLGVPVSQLPQLAKVIVALSPKQKNLLLNAGCKAESISVIPNGVSLAAFPAAPPEGRDYRELVFAGALVADKGAHLLIDAFLQLRVKYNDLKLSIYGSAALWGREDYLNWEGIGKLPGITTHGAVSQEELAKAYCRGGLLVQPSLWFESFGLVVAEAQSCGLPAVVSRWCGMADIVQDGVTGRHLKEATVQAVTTLLDEMLAAPEKLKEMSQAALETVRGKYTWENTAKLMLEALEYSASCSTASSTATVTTGSTGAQTTVPREIAGVKSASCRTGQPKVALLTTYNQPCGLASYAMHLRTALSHIDMEGGAEAGGGLDVWVLAEKISEMRTTKKESARSQENSSCPVGTGNMGADDDRVIRCWQREDGNYSELRQVLFELRPDVLHINCHPRFFVFPEFGKLLNDYRKAGGAVVTLVHNPYTVDPVLRDIALQSDEVVVHLTENILELLACGVPHEKLSVVEQGVKTITSLSRRAARMKLGLSDDESGSLNGSPSSNLSRGQSSSPNSSPNNSLRGAWTGEGGGFGSSAEREILIATFGFLQPHKGIDDIVLAVEKLRGLFPKIGLVILGGVHEEDPHSREYVANLKQYVNDRGLGEHIVFVDGFISEEKVDTYLKAADIIVLNYRSNYYEGSAALARALGSGNPVICSTAPTFARLGATVFHATSGFPIEIAIKSIIEQPELRAELKLKTREFVIANCWDRAAERYTEIYQRAAERRHGALESQPEDSSRRPEMGSAMVENRRANTAEKDAQSISPQSINTGSITARDNRGRKARVLMKNRPNAVENPGGDTIVMQRTAQYLQASGVDVVVDLEGNEDPRQFDLVHIYNFATPEITEQFASQAHACGTPYIVTTLYEDLPVFYNQMNAYYEALCSYVQCGQRSSQWFGFNSHAQQIQPSGRWENSWTAKHAAMLIATGERERATLLRDYPGVRTTTFQLGCDVSTLNDEGTKFREHTGINDFILCVGRLETRKNQLMLLKALEDSELTVVFATGGFTYQPDYSQLCRGFKRRGKTVFLDRLSRDMLVSAYGACRAHVLPSWYELPGIVSMEAARLGKNVVVTDNGTARDYFGNHAFYCQPNDTSSIYQAVMSAAYAPANSELQQRMSSCTWDGAGQRILEIYADVLRSKFESGVIQPLAVAGARQAASRLASPAVSSEDSRGVVLGALQELQSVTDAAIEQTAELVSTAYAPLLSEKASKAVEELCNAGDDLLESSKLSEARNSYLQAHRDCPEHSRPPRSMGVSYLLSDELASAINWFDRALAVRPGDERALVGKGVALSRVGSFAAGLGCLLQAIDLNYIDLQMLPEFVRAGYASANLNGLERGIARFVQAYPGNLDVRFCYAGVLYKSGKVERAREECLSILRQNGEYADAKQLLDMMSPNIMPVGATTVGMPFGEALSSRDGTVADRSAQCSGERPFNLRANMHGEVTRGAQCGASQEQSCNAGSPYLSSEPRENSWVAEDEIRTIEFLKKDKNYQEALEQCNRIASNKSLTTEEKQLVAILRAEMLACLEQCELAERELQFLRNSEFYADRVLAGLGTMKLVRGNVSEAGALFRQALDINRANDVALAGLGMCLCAEGQNDQAWQRFQEAVIHNPESTRAILGVIELGYQRGELEVIESVLKKYLTLHSADLNMMYSLAGCLFRQHRNEEARDMLERILMFDPSHTFAQELMVHIDSFEVGDAQPSAEE